MDITRANIVFPIKNISQLKSQSSEVITVRNLPWKITVSKCTKNGVDALSVFLHCMNEDISSCIAVVIFQLLSYSDYVETFRKELEPHEFQGTTSWGFPNFITWNELLNPVNKYVETDTIILETEIRADPVMDPTASNLKLLANISEQSFQFTANRIRQMLGFVTPEFDAHGLPWKVKVYKRQYGSTHDDMKMLCCKLFCTEKKATDWSCYVEVKYSLIPFDTSKQLLESTNRSCLFNNGTKVNIGTDMILMKDLLNPQKKYVKDGSITVKVKIRHSSKNPTATTQVPMPCPICLENLMDKSIVAAECGHLYCDECIENVKNCSICRKIIFRKRIRPIYLP